MSSISARKGLQVDGKAASQGSAIPTRWTPCPLIDGQSWSSSKMRLDASGLKQTYQGRRVPSWEMGTTARMTRIVSRDHCSRSHELHVLSRDYGLSSRPHVASE